MSVIGTILGVLGPVSDAIGSIAGGGNKTRNYFVDDINTSQLIQKVSASVYATLLQMYPNAPEHHGRGGGYSTINLTRQQWQAYVNSVVVPPSIPPDASTPPLLGGGGIGGILDNITDILNPSPVAPPSSSEGGTTSNAGSSNTLLLFGLILILFLYASRRR